MPPNWPETTKELSAQLKNVRSGVPEVVKAFSAVAQAALAPKALDTKTKELIALAISVAIRCDDCIAFHAKAAVDQGASRDEVLETLGLAIYMGCGPVGDVCGPRARGGRAVRGGAGAQARVTARHRGGDSAKGRMRRMLARGWCLRVLVFARGWRAGHFPFRVDTRGSRSHKHGPRVAPLRGKRVL